MFADEVGIRIGRESTVDIKSDDKNDKRLYVLCALYSNPARRWGIGYYDVEDKVAKILIVESLRIYKQEEVRSIIR